MNSEELEQSLRSEFESYLKTVQADMKQDVAEFQTKIEAEFDKHRAQTSDAFQQFAARFDSGKEVDEGFRQLVAEHLKLARDEGAKVSATAYAEAEKLDALTVAAAPANYAEIRDAIADISSKDSQSTILKSLVEHAENFAPRGAFFIIKNEHFAGWKVFGEDAEADDATVRDIHFSTSEDSILGTATSTRATAEGYHGDHSADKTFLEPLNFGEPERMYAIPLIARGRGVAVLYADKGTAGRPANVEALETLVSVAGLTVELLASAQTARSEHRDMAEADFEGSQDAAERTDTHTTEADPVSPFASEAESASDFKFSDSVSWQGGMPVEAATEEDAAPAEEYRYEPDETPMRAFEQAEEVPETATAYSFEREDPVETAEEYRPFEETPTTAEEEIVAEIEPETAFQPEIVAEEATPAFDPEPEDEQGEPEVESQPEAEEESLATEPYVESFHGFETNSGAPAFDNGASEPAASPFESAIEPFAPAGTIGGGYEAKAPEPAPVPVPVVEVTTPAPSHGRLSDRPVDLPIEVPEDERRLHNDARRFARLLVSEIKLYNEKKVLDGREAHDLYERLREAIDRSREMYDKRVQPPVAARFDYFHYELLNSLAEGSAENFGNGYPGATV